MTALSKLLQCEIPDNVLLGLFTLTDRVIKHHHSKYVWSLREHRVWQCKTYEVDVCIHLFILIPFNVGPVQNFACCGTVLVQVAA